MMFIKQNTNYGGSCMVLYVRLVSIEQRWKIQKLLQKTYKLEIDNECDWFLLDILWPKWPIPIVSSCTCRTSNLTLR